MNEDHSRYERLAVGHVVGGLDEVDAAAFRQHLIGCRECRLRVSELRDIASDLAAAERDERAAARVATEVEQRQQEAPARVDVAPWRAWPWTVVGAALVVTGLLVVLVWNLVLRTNEQTLVDATQRLQGVLEVLAAGEPLATTMETGTEGLVVSDGEEVALDLTGVRTPAPDERIVVWQLDADGASLLRTPLAAPPPGAEGQLATTVALQDGAATVALTLEDFPVDVEAPTGLRLVTAELP